MVDQAKIIGIGGISRSGKSFLARELSVCFARSGRRAETFDQDDFVFHGSRIPLINNHVDWERPESVDFRKFSQAITAAVASNDIIIAEGLMVFWDPSFFNLLDYSIYIELPRDEFIERKKIDLRWGEEPLWYIEHIWDSHQVYGQFPAGGQPDLVLDGSVDFDIDDIFSKINRKFSNPV